MFNPTQPRDASGKWAAGDSASHSGFGPVTVTKDHGGGMYSVKTAAGRRELAYAPELSPPSPAASSLASAPLPEFARRVQTLADAQPKGWGSDRVFISHVYQSARAAEPGLSEEAFKGRLKEANRAGLVRLSRADLVSAMDPADVRASEISLDPGKAATAANPKHTAHFMDAAAKQRKSVGVVRLSAAAWRTGPLNLSGDPGDEETVPLPGESVLALGYNANQPRDERGRWMGGAGSDTADARGATLRATVDRKGGKAVNVYAANAVHTVAVSKRDAAAPGTPPVESHPYQVTHNAAGPMSRPGDRTQRSVTYHATEADARAAQVSKAESVERAARTDAGAGAHLRTTVGEAAKPQFHPFHDAKVGGQPVLPGAKGAAGMNAKESGGDKVPAGAAAGDKPYVAPAGSKYADVPNAGNNKSIYDTEHAKGLVKRLDTYERSFIEQEAKDPNKAENLLHHNAMYDSGLTEEGLMTARGYAGKKVSMKPGVFFPEAAPRTGADLHNPTPGLSNADKMGMRSRAATARVLNRMGEHQAAKKYGYAHTLSAAGWRGGVLTLSADAPPARVAACPNCKSAKVWRGLPREGHGRMDHCLNCGYAFPMVPGSVVAPPQSATPAPTPTLLSVGGWKGGALTLAAADEGHWRDIDGHAVFLPGPDAATGHTWSGTKGGSKSNIVRTAKVQTTEGTKTVSIKPEGEGHRVTDVGPGSHFETAKHPTEAAALDDARGRVVAHEAAAKGAGTHVATKEAAGENAGMETGPVAGGTPHERAAALSSRAVAYAKAGKTMKEFTDSVPDAQAAQLRGELPQTPAQSFSRVWKDAQKGTDRQGVIAADAKAVAEAKVKQEAEHAVRQEEIKRAAAESEKRQAEQREAYQKAEAARAKDDAERARLKQEKSDAQKKNLNEGRALAVNGQFKRGGEALHVDEATHAKIIDHFGTNEGVKVAAGGKEYKVTGVGSPFKDESGVKSRYLYLETPQGQARQSNLTRPAVGPVVHDEFEGSKPQQGDLVMRGDVPHVVTKIHPSQYWSHDRIHDEDEFGKSVGWHTPVELTPVAWKEGDPETPSMEKARKGKEFESFLKDSPAEAVHDELPKLYHGGDDDANAFSRPRAVKDRPGIFIHNGPYPARPQYFRQRADGKYEAIGRFKPND